MLQFNPSIYSLRSKRLRRPDSIYRSTYPPGFVVKNRRVPQGVALDPADACDINRYKQEGH